MTGTNCDLFTHNQSRSYLNHLVLSTWKVSEILSGRSSVRRLIKFYKSSDAESAGENFSEFCRRESFKTYLV